MEGLFLACDMGTSGVHCSLFDLEGNVAAKAHRLWKYERDPDSDEGLMLDLNSALTLMCEAIRETISADGVQPSHIRAVSASSQRLGLVLIDDRGTDVKCIPNIDRRANDEASYVGAQWGRLIYSRTGRWPGPGHPLNKLLWIKQHEPELYSKASRLLSLGDWLMLRLGGAAATEATSACETCLYDIIDGRWNVEIAQKTGIGLSMLPEIAPSGTVIGEIDQTASEKTGLPREIPLVLGAADTECGVLGLGGCEAGDLAVIAGSSAPIEMIVEQPAIDTEYRTLTNPYIIPGQWVVESNAMLTGASYRWLLSTFGPSGGHGDLSRSFLELEAEIADSPFGAHGALCYLGSSIMDSRKGNFPQAAAIVAPMPSVRGSELGRGDLARATLEAEAFAIKANIEQLSLVAGKVPSEILAGGGSLKSPAFRSILSDILGIPILCSDDEATPRGCAMCAAFGAGYFNSIADACVAMSPQPTVLEPNSIRVELYDPLYKRWLNGFRQIKNFQL